MEKQKITREQPSTAQIKLGHYNSQLSGPDGNGIPELEDLALRSELV